MDEEYVERVLALVEAVPPGRVTTYGTLAGLAGRGGPRQAGRVLARHGDAVPWWRVVYADGRPATCHGGEAPTLLRAEGTPLTDRGTVDLATGAWPAPLTGTGTGTGTGTEEAASRTAPGRTR